MSDDNESPKTPQPPPPARPDVEQVFIELRENPTPLPHKRG